MFRSRFVFLSRNKKKGAGGIQFCLSRSWEIRPKKAGGGGDLGLKGKFSALKMACLKHEQGLPKSQTNEKWGEGHVAPPPYKG